MKKLAYIFAAAACVACNSAPESETEKTPSTEVKPLENKFAGSWNLDSSSYLKDGEQTVMSLPVQPTVWIFGEDSTYRVEYNVALLGTYYFTPDSLFVNLMEVPNSYQILELNETKLRLRSTILETDSSTVQTDVYLTRK